MSGAQWPRRLPAELTRRNLPPITTLQGRLCDEAAMSRGQIRIRGAILAALAAVFALAGCASLDAQPRPDMVMGAPSPVSPTQSDWVADTLEQCSRIARPMLRREEVIAYAGAMQRALAARHVDVALVFEQSGAPRWIMPPNVQYGHGAIFIRQPDSPSGEPRYLTYNLLPGYGRGVPCGRSSLVTWPVENFDRAVTALDQAVIVPTPALQARIRAIVGSPVYARVHNPAFSIIANPLDERFQNCAGLMLHVLVAAAWNVTDHEAVNLILREKFQPSRIDANAAVRLLGPLASSRLAAGDQDWTVSTASFESIDVFMRQNGLSQETFIFYFDPRPADER